MLRSLMVALSSARSRILVVILSVFIGLVLAVTVLPQRATSPSQQKPSPTDSASRPSHEVVGTSTLAAGNAKSTLGSISLDPVARSKHWREELVAQAPSLRTAFEHLSKERDPESSGYALQLASVCAQYNIVPNFDVSQVGKQMPADIWPHYHAAQKVLSSRCASFAANPAEMVDILRKARSTADKADMPAKKLLELHKALGADKEINGAYLNDFLAHLSPRLIAEAGPLYHYADVKSGFAEPGDASLWQLAAVLATCSLGNDCSRESYFSTTSCIGLGYCSSSGLEGFLANGVQLTHAQREVVSRAAGRIVLRYKSREGRGT